MMSLEKMYFIGLDLLKPNVIEPTKMPRTAVISIVKDKRTGYLNAAPYSGGVMKVSPLHVLISPKSHHAIESFKHAEEFCLSIPKRDQVDQMWVMALEVPHGINEVEVAGWHQLESQEINTPGIKECPINLECRKIFFGQLPPPWRAIVIGEVIGVSIDKDLLSKSRAEVIKLLPLHEAGAHPETGLYGLSVLSGELIPFCSTLRSNISACEEREKIYVGSSELYKPENAHILANVIWPRPSYVLITSNTTNHAKGLPVCGGSLQSTEPAVFIPVPKDSSSYQDIKKTGRFVISIPDRNLIERFERFEITAPEGFEEAGFSLLRPNLLGIPGISECPVTIDCKAVMFEDVPDTDYAILVGRKVGVVLNKEIYVKLDPAIHSLRERLSFINKLYASYIYAVMDYDMTRKWGFHDEDVISVRPLPSWGSRYTGAWWGPGQALDFWLIELCDEKLITKREYYKIKYALRLWNDGMGIPHLAEFISDEFKEDLRRRLTKLFRMMVWAHRDYNEWEKVHEYLSTFPDEPRDHHSGPIYHKKWYSEMI